MKVDLNGLCKDYGVRTVSYSSAQQVIHDHDMVQLTNRTAGFCFFL